MKTSAKERVHVGERRWARRCVATETRAETAKMFTVSLAVTAPLVVGTNWSRVAIVFFEI